MVPLILWASAEIIVGLAFMLWPERLRSWTLPDHRRYERWPIKGTSLWSYRLMGFGFVFMGIFVLELATAGGEQRSGTKAPAATADLVVGLLLVAAGAAETLWPERLRSFPWLHKPSARLPAPARRVAQLLGVGLVAMGAYELSRFLAFVS